MQNIFSIFILIAVFSLVSHSAGAQQTPDLQLIKSGKPYRVWLMAKTDKLKAIGSGELYQLYDDSLGIVNPLKATPPVNYSIKDIDQIWLRRKGKIGRGILAGAITGVVAGVILGYASGDGDVALFSMTAGEKAALLGLAMGQAGAFIGLGVGAGKIKIPIDRRKDKYLPVRDALKRTKYPPEK